MLPPLLPEQFAALVALCQAAGLIDHLALTGTVDAAALQRLLDDLLLGEPAPASADDYAIGRTTLRDLLRGELPEPRQCVPRYLRAMLRLERKLARRPDLSETLGLELARARQVQAHYARSADSVCAALSGAYLASIGRLRHRVLVTGALRQISRDDTADRIRALLLAGIEAAARWREAGGRHWQLRFRRARILAALRKLDEEAGADGQTPRWRGQAVR